MPDDLEPQSNGDWPPRFTLDQERVLNLLTGDRFYSDSSAALREAVLNAIDAVYRRREIEPKLDPEILLEFDRPNLRLTIRDNGDGMNRAAVAELFTRVGASASKLSGSRSVGEFGIGVISYFMAGDEFQVETCDGVSETVALRFTRAMLAGGSATPIPTTMSTRGTIVTIIAKDAATFATLEKSVPHWCRDVAGFEARRMPEDIPVAQGGISLPDVVAELPAESWIETAHLAPVSNIGGWESMSGKSTISVLYRGVFVQEFEIQRLWGIEGSINVDPKHFKPRLNREGFVQGPFEREVQDYLRRVHPKILEEMAGRLSFAIDNGDLDRWAARRWATLWLSIPRGQEYSAATAKWDAVFRRLPAFELAVGDKWEEISLNKLIGLARPFYVMPLRDKDQSEVVKAALRLLRHTKRTVIRGLQAERSWLRDVPYAFNTTADLITDVFRSELTELSPLEAHAETVLQHVEPVATLYGGAPSVQIVRIGSDSPPILRIRSRLLINLDHVQGKLIVSDAICQNSGRWSLLTIVAKHSYQHISEVAASIRESDATEERLGLVRRRFLRGLL